MYNFRVHWANSADWPISLGEALAGLFLVRCRSFLGHFRPCEKAELCIQRKPISFLTRIFGSRTLNSER